VDELLSPFALVVEVLTGFDSKQLVRWAALIAAGF